MPYNTPPPQPDYISINNFNMGSQIPLDTQQQQKQQLPQQMPISPPPFHSPLIYESGNRTSAGSSSGSSVDFDTLRYKNDMCKSFEDDLFYCPRSLLSAQEQLTCERMDMFMAEQLRECQVPQQKNVHTSSPTLGFSRPKFNPYTSQSFSPAPNT